VYLQTGLCIILAFIGAKLLGEALRGVGVTMLGPIPVPQVSSWLSLVVIILVLATTAVASVLATRRRARNAKLPGPAACDGQRCAARRPAGSGGQGVAQVRHDVPDGDLDRLAGGARGDLDGAVGQATLAHGHPERDPGELRVAELDPGPLGPVVDDDVHA